MTRSAVAHGWHEVYHTRNDTGLDAIRTQPGFQAPLLDMAFPAEPFARGD